MAKICLKCRHQNNDTATVCQHCGQSLPSIRLLEYDPGPTKQEIVVTATKTTARDIPRLIWGATIWGMIIFAVVGAAIVALRTETDSGVLKVGAGLVGTIPGAMAGGMIGMMSGIVGAGALVLCVGLPDDVRSSAIVLAMVLSGFPIALMFIASGESSPSEQAFPALPIVLGIMIGCFFAGLGALHYVHHPPEPND